MSRDTWKLAGRRALVTGALPSCLAPSIALFPHSGILVPLMAKPLDPKDLVTLGELAIARTWKFASYFSVHATKPFNFLQGEEVGMRGCEETTMVPYK